MTKEEILAFAIKINKGKKYGAIVNLAKLMKRERRYVSSVLRGDFPINDKFLFQIERLKER
jgi:hypothetical protein